MLSESYRDHKTNSAMDSSATSEASESSANFWDDDEVPELSHQTVLEANNRGEEYPAAATTHVDWDEILGDSRALRLDPMQSPSESSAPDSADDGAQDAESGLQGVSLSVGYAGFIGICLRSFRLARRENPEQLDLIEKRHRLAIWADGFDDEPSLAELLSLVGAAYVGKSILIALASIATNLLDFLGKNAESIGAEIETMVEQLPSEVKTIHSRLHPPRSSHSDYTEPDLELTLEAITDSIDSLYSLMPYIDDIQSEYEESKVGGDQAFDSLTREYQRYITQRDWKLDPVFVTRLAQLNARRYQKIRLWADQPVPLPSTVSQPTISKTSGTSFAESSLFDRAESAYSASSVASTTPDKGERIRYPKVPLPVLPGGSACCTICHDPTVDISTSRKWRAHVRADLVPYICMELNCPAEDAQFNSVRDWQKHDKDFHRNVISYACVHPCTKVWSNDEALKTHILKDHLKGQSTLLPSALEDLVARCAQYDDTSVLKKQYQCDFCGEAKTGKTALRRHLGRHMVDLAMKVLPQEYYGSDSEEQSNSAGDESELSEVSNSMRDRNTPGAIHPERELGHASGEDSSIDEFKVPQHGPEYKGAAFNSNDYVSSEFPGPIPAAMLAAQQRHDQSLGETPQHQGQIQQMMSNENNNMAQRLREESGLLQQASTMQTALMQQENKPFKCPVIGCEKAYKNQNGLKYHKAHGHTHQQLHDNSDGTFSIVNPETSSERRCLDCGSDEHRTRECTHIPGYEEALSDSRPTSPPARNMGRAQGLAWYCRTCRDGPLNPDFDVVCPNCGSHREMAEDDTKPPGPSGVTSSSSVPPPQWKKVAEVGVRVYSWFTP